MPEFLDIFDWEGWDEITENVDVYYNCVMLRTIGYELYEDEVFEQIYFNKSKLTLDFYRTPTDTNPIKKHFVLKE